MSKRDLLTIEVKETFYTEIKKTYAPESELKETYALNE